MLCWLACVRPVCSALCVFTNTVWKQSACPNSDRTVQTVSHARWPSASLSNSLRKMCCYAAHRSDSRESAARSLHSPTVRCSNIDDCNHTAIFQAAFLRTNTHTATIQLLLSLVSLPPSSWRSSTLIVLYLLLKSFLTVLPFNWLFATELLINSLGLLFNPQCPFCSSCSVVSFGLLHDCVRVCVSLSLCAKI